MNYKDVIIQEFYQFIEIFGYNQCYILNYVKYSPKGGQKCPKTIVGQKCFSIIFRPG
jgi:hypothetical protein